MMWCEGTLDVPNNCRVSIDVLSFSTKSYLQRNVSLVTITSQFKINTCCRLQICWISMLVFAMNKEPFENLTYLEVCDILSLLLASTVFCATHVMTKLRRVEHDWFWNWQQYKFNSHGYIEVWHKIRLIYHDITDGYGLTMFYANW